MLVKLFSIFYLVARITKTTHRNSKNCPEDERSLTKVYFEVAFDVT